MDINDFESFTLQMDKVVEEIRKIKENSNISISD